MAVVLLRAPGYLSSQAMEVAGKECCQAQQVATSGRQGERRLMEDVDAIIGASMRPTEGCIGCITATTTATDIDSWVASVVNFAGDNCSQSSLIQGLRGCPNVFHSSSCNT